MLQQNSLENPEMLETLYLPGKVNNRNAKTRSEICSKLTINIPERRHWLLIF